VKAPSRCDTWGPYQEALSPPTTRAWRNVDARRWPSLSLSLLEQAQSTRQNPSNQSHATKLCSDDGSNPSGLSVPIGSLAARACRLIVGHERLRPHVASTVVRGVNKSAACAPQTAQGLGPGGPDMPLGFVYLCEGTMHSIWCAYVNNHPYQCLASSADEAQLRIWTQVLASAADSVRLTNIRPFKVATL